MTKTPIPRDERITAAALDLLRAKGPRAVTIEAVAARSGVARTTIYRRYRDRDEMLTAALASVTQPEPPTEGSALLPVLDWLVHQSRHAIEGGIGVGGAAALLTEEDPEFTELIRSLLVQHRHHLADALRSPELSGELRDDLDAETILDFVVGAYLAERARNGAVEPGWSGRVLRALRPAITRIVP